MTPFKRFVTSSALSLYIYSLTFLRWYISFDSPLKRCLKDTFLLPLLTCVFLSLTISFFSSSIWPWPVWLCCFRCERCFDLKQHRLHPRPPCLISIPKTFIDLWFCVQTTRKSSQVERNLQWNFEQAQIGRKPPQAIASWQSNEAQACDDLHSCLIRAVPLIYI